MIAPPDLATLLRQHLRARFANKGSQALARLVNERFTEQPDVDFLTRNTLDNWLRGYVKTVREWEKLAAVAAALGLSELEADQLLRAAGQLTIAEKRPRAERAIEQQILAHWPETTPDPALPASASFTSEQRVDPAGSPPPAADVTRPVVTALAATAQPEPAGRVLPAANTRRWLLIGSSLLLVLAVAWVGWQRRTIQPTLPSNQPASGATPFFTDDFTNPGRWDLSEAPHVTFTQGRLWFEPPLNDTNDWNANVVNPQWSLEMPLARVRFTIGLEMTLDQTWGFLGVQTECFSEQYADDDGDNDWLLVYLGGLERTLWVEYTPSETQVPLQELPFEPITTDQPYTIDLIWAKPGVQVYLDGKPQGEVIPCLRPRQFNLNAGLYPGTQVRGYIDDLQLWN